MDKNAKRRLRHAELRDGINERRRARYASQREKVLQAMRADRVVCPLCGREVRRLYLKTHQQRHNCKSHQMKYGIN